MSIIRSCQPENKNIFILLKTILYHQTFSLWFHFSKTRFIVCCVCLHIPQVNVGTHITCDLRCRLHCPVCLLEQDTVTSVHTLSTSSRTDSPLITCEHRVHLSSGPDRFAPGKVAASRVLKIHMLSLPCTDEFQLILYLFLRRGQSRVNQAGIQPEVGVL